MSDLFHAFKSHENWFYMGIQDIKQRYARSVIGPWWVTISMGLMVLVLGILWTHIFKIDSESYVPQFSVGMVFWIFISGYITESCKAFILYEGLIKQRRVYFYTFILRLLVKHLVIFCHNLVILIFIFIYYSISLSWIQLSIFFIGLWLILMVLVPLGMSIAILATRYRDIEQLIVNIMNLSFYVTPVIWLPNYLLDKKNYLYLNPFYDLISIVRNPILNINFDPYLYISWLVIFLVSWSLSFILYHANYKKIAYWI